MEHLCNNRISMEAFAHSDGGAVLTLAHENLGMHNAATVSKLCHCQMSNAAGHPLLAGLGQDMSSGYCGCPTAE